jgi:nitric oxide reductase NorD protein
LNDGEELDFDAMIESFIDVFSKASPSEKVYISKRKREKELGILFLVDTSLSTDSYVLDRKILNTEIESLLVFGQSLNDLGFEFAMHTFNSHTRNHSNYNIVKDFQESWEQAKNKIPSIYAEGYTRIGPALRHACHLLEKQQYEKKAIILLSDGKPNDYDRYEGKYGIEDVKKALTETRNKNIHSFALAIESGAKYYLPQMFGVNNFEIMSNVALLPSVFIKFIERLKK